MKKTFFVYKERERERKGICVCVKSRSLVFWCVHTRSPISRVGVADSWSMMMPS